MTILTAAGLRLGENSGYDEAVLGARHPCPSLQRRSSLKPVVIGPVCCAVRAPPPLVYQMLAAIGQGSAGNGERAEVLERDGDQLVCDFWTRVRLPGGVDRLVRTRERVTLRAPNRVDYEHLDGPVRGLRESITIAPGPAGSAVLSYSGSYEPRNLLDALRARLLARPAIRRVMKQHFEDFRQRAESRATRSRVFPSDARDHDRSTATKAR